jgi:hypothetical protein
MFPDLQKTTRHVEAALLRLAGPDRDERLAVLDYGGPD